jgi:hypothetical protein
MFRPALRLTTGYRLFYRRSKDPGAGDRPFTPLLLRLGMRGVLSPFFPTYFQVFDRGTSPLQSTIQDTQTWKEVYMSLVHPWLVLALLRIACPVDHNRLTTQLTQLAAGCTEEKACFSTHSQNLMMWNDNNQVTLVSHPLEILEHSICTHVVTKYHSRAVLSRSISVLRTTNKCNMKRIRRNAVKSSFSQNSEYATARQTTPKQNKHKKLRGFSLPANYTDRATAACRRSQCQL